MYTTHTCTWTHTNIHTIIAHTLSYTNIHTSKYHKETPDVYTAPSRWSGGMKRGESKHRHSLVDHWDQQVRGGVLLHKCHVGSRLHELVVAYWSSWCFCCCCCSCCVHCRWSIHSWTDWKKVSAPNVITYVVSKLISTSLAHEFFYRLCSIVWGEIRSPLNSPKQNDVIFNLIFVYICSQVFLFFLKCDLWPLI